MRKFQYKMFNSVSEGNKSSKKFDILLNVPTADLWIM